MINNNCERYPIDTLMSSNMLIDLHQMAKNAIKIHNYECLKVLSTVAVHFSFKKNDSEINIPNPNSTTYVDQFLYDNILAEAVTAFDRSAIDVVLNTYHAMMYKMRNLNVALTNEDIFFSLKLDLQNFENFLDYKHNSPNSEQYNKTKMKSFFLKKGEIYKYILANKNQYHINDIDLKILSKYITKSDFNSFIIRNKIDLKDEKFSKLDIKHYQLYDDILLGKDIEITNNTTTEDIILTRTFSNIFSLEQIRTLYQNVINLDPIADTFMKAVALSILKPNDAVGILSITFNSHTHSSYIWAGYLNYNDVWININSNDPFKLESIIIHEFGHYTADFLFHALALPFDISEISKIIKLYEDFLDNNNHIKIIDAIGNVKNIIINTKEFVEQEALPLLEKILQHAQSVQEALLYATKLLATPIEQKIEQHYDLHKMIQYFQDNSYISLFRYARYVQNVTHSEHEETKNRLLLNGNMQKKYIEAYLQYNGASYTNGTDPQIQEIQSIVIEKIYPKLVTELQLTKEEIFYLERIADYIHRGDDCLKYHYKHNRECTAVEFDREFIVRYLELKSAIGSSESGQKILAALSTTRIFLEQNIVPYIDQMLADFNTEQEQLGYKFDFLSYNKFDNAYQPVVNNTDDIHNANNTSTTNSSVIFNADDVVHEQMEIELLEQCNVIDIFTSSHQEL